MILRRFFIRLSNFITARRADQRLREEMAEHLALQTQENLRAGMSPTEARRQAALKLGAAQAIREQHNAEQGVPIAENLLLDIRYAFRMLHRSPVFSLIAIATTPGFNNEVVISDGLWKRAFGADPHILGKTLRLDNDPAHVVGVMPASFRDQGQSSEQRGTDLWAAGGFADDPAPPPMRGTRLPFETIARLQPGLSPEAAQGRLDALVASLKKQYPADYPSHGAWTIHLTPLAETLVGNVRQSLILLFGAVGLVLLISCVNAPNLLFLGP